LNAVYESGIVHARAGLKVAAFNETNGVAIVAVGAVAVATGAFIVAIVVALIRRCFRQRTRRD
jgi:nitrate reductase gamma subunit